METFSVKCVAWPGRMFFVHKRPCDAALFVCRWLSIVVGEGGDVCHLICISFSPSKNKLNKHRVAIFCRVSTGRDRHAITGGRASAGGSGGSSRTCVGVPRGRGASSTHAAVGSQVSQPVNPYTLLSILSAARGISN